MPNATRYVANCAWHCNTSSNNSCRATSLPNAQPSRLCAVFRLHGAHLSEEAVAAAKTGQEWANLGEAFRNPVNDVDDDELNERLV